MNSPTAPLSGTELTRHAPVPVGTLRILATTDLHAHLLPYDYVHDRAAPGTGLAGIATLIHEARHEAAEIGAATVLLDNGDLLQGTPLGERLATTPISKDHAIAACLNALHYDAVGIGNHDFDYGLGPLRAVADILDAPMICSNLSGVPLHPIQSRALIRRKLPGAAEAEITIGVLSLLPRLTKIWSKQALGPEAQILSLQETLVQQAQMLRSDGADLIVVLAHMGPGGTADEGALALTKVSGADVLITGHTHRRLPGRDYVGRPGVDAMSGRLCQIPAVMAGFAGSDLGVIDLTLARDGDEGWVVHKGACALRPNTEATQPDARIVSLSTPAHHATCAEMAREVGHSDDQKHSYFSLLQPCPLTRMVAEAKARMVARCLVGHPDEDLPLLAAVATRGSGGREGPCAFLDIPKGPVLRRHIQGLAPYANQIIGARVTGAELRRWAERSVEIYQTASPGGSMIDTSMPAFHHDTIYGLTYNIDLMQPPGQRVQNMRHAGIAVSDTAVFIIATHEFRLAGGGGYDALPDDRIVARTDQTLREELIAGLSDAPECHFTADAPWGFTPLGGVEMKIDTSPLARPHLGDIADFAPRALGETPDGFLRLSVRL